MLIWYLWEMHTNMGEGIVVLWKTIQFILNFKKKILVIITRTKCGTQMNSLYIFITNNDFFTFIIQRITGVFTLVATHMGHQNKQKKKQLLFYIYLTTKDSTFKLWYDKHVYWLWTIMCMSAGNTIFSHKCLLYKPGLTTVHDQMSESAVCSLV